MSHKEYKKQYKEIEVIGRGNFGSATLVERIDSKKQYIAKKIVLSSLNTKQQDAALQEAQLLKDLNHKNIVSYVESFKEDEILIIVMEYCEHGDLAFHIKRKKQKKEHFPEMLIVSWFFELALSLKYIHEKKILHRDIKTSNIFITKDGTIKIGDFGISKVLENTTSVAKTVVGTPYYMSPEVCESKPYTYKSDVWALGCVLYELCALELLNKNEEERPVIQEILNDIGTQRLFKQYLEVKPDSNNSLKQESAINNNNNKKLPNLQSSQSNNTTPTPIIPNNNNNNNNNNSNANAIQNNNINNNNYNNNNINIDAKGNSNKENNGLNQLGILNQGDRMNVIKNNNIMNSNQNTFVDTSSPINTVDSQMINQINFNHQQSNSSQQSFNLMPLSSASPTNLQFQSQSSPSYSQQQQEQQQQYPQKSQQQQCFHNKSNQRQQPLPVRLEQMDYDDEYYYNNEDDDVHHAFKSKKDQFKEENRIKQNNYLRQEGQQQGIQTPIHRQESQSSYMKQQEYSPQTLQKVQSQQTFNHQSKYKNHDISSFNQQFDMHSSAQPSFNNNHHPSSFPSTRDKAYSQPQQQNGYQINGNNNNNNSSSNTKQKSHMYNNQNNNISQFQQQQQQQQQQQMQMQTKLTPKEMARMKKDEKNRQQQEQLTEYTKSQAKFSLISRERYIQNVYGDKFLPNQSNLKQYEESVHKQNKQQLHLEPINQQNAKQQSSQQTFLQDNFMHPNNHSPNNNTIYQSTHQQFMTETQFQQDVPLPIRNGTGQRSPTSRMNNRVQNEENKIKNEFQQELDYPIEGMEKLQIQSVRRKKNSSKSDVMNLMHSQDYDQNNIEQNNNNNNNNNNNKHIPNHKSQFSHPIVVVGNHHERRIINAQRSHTVQNDLADSDLFEQQYYINKTRSNKLQDKQGLQQQQQQQQQSHLQNTQFESNIGLQSSTIKQDQYSHTQYQDIPVFKKINNEQTQLQQQQQSSLQSFESFFSKEDLIHEQPEQLHIIQQNQQKSKDLGQNTKVKQSHSMNNNNQQQSHINAKRNGSDDDEYGKETFEDYFSDEDAQDSKPKQNQPIIHPQSAHDSNNNNNTNNKNNKQISFSIRKLSSQSSYLQKLESIQENDCEQTQYTPIDQSTKINGQQYPSHPSIPSRKTSAGGVGGARPSSTRTDNYINNNNDSGLKQNSKKLISHQSSISSSDETTTQHPSSRMSNNHSRNSPRNIIDTSAYKNNQNSSINSNQSKLISLRQKCKQNLGDNFNKVYDTIQKSIESNLKDYKMKQLLVEIVGKNKINDCFEVEQLIYIEQEEVQKK